jgi:S-adenosylmethionine hydrolase
MKMLIVTLTTDWKDGDYNIGRLKACIISKCNDVRIIDINHNILSYNTLQAAFILKNTYGHFPPGTIHVVGVNSEPSPKNQIAMMKNDEHFFIGANNGMLSLICDKQPDSIIELPYGDNYQGFRFMELLGNCIKAVSVGLKLEEFGNTCELHRTFTGNPSCYESRITGFIIYIDAFGNAITNIDKKTFDKTGKNRKFKISIQSNLAEITKLSQYYDDVHDNKIVAMFNSIGLLELAMNKGNIARIYSLDRSLQVTINFTS